MCACICAHDTWDTSCLGRREIFGIVNTIISFVFSVFVVNNNWWMDQSLSLVEQVLVYFQSLSVHLILSNSTALPHSPSQTEACFSIAAFVYDANFSPRHGNDLYIRPVIRNSHPLFAGLSGSSLSFSESKSKTRLFCSAYWYVVSFLSFPPTHHR